MKADAKKPKTLAELLARCGPGVQRANASLLDQTAALGRVAQDTEQQRNIDHVPLAEITREIADQMRRLVRITSFRVRLVDRRNLWDKHFTDALVEAGILFDDAPQWCRIEVEQQQVDHYELERTEITIEPL